MGARRESQRKHQGGGVTDLARITERLVGVSERGIGIAKKPQHPRPKGQHLPLARPDQNTSPADDAR